jgi:hypothetical protein
MMPQGQANHRVERSRATLSPIHDDSYVGRRCLNRLLAVRLRRLGAQRGRDGCDKGRDLRHLMLIDACQILQQSLGDLERLSNIMDQGLRQLAEW